MFKLKTLAAVARCHTRIILCITLNVFNSIKRMQNENITVNVYTSYIIFYIDIILFSRRANALNAAE